MLYAHTSLFFAMFLSNSVRMRFAPSAMANTPTLSGFPHIPRIDFPPLNRNQKTTHMKNKKQNMKLGKVKIKMEYVVNLDNENMIKEAKNALYEDLMNAYKYDEIYNHIEVTEQDESLKECDIPEFLLEKDE